MTTDRVKLQVQERGERGSAACRRLRGAGFVPGVLYGRGVKPRAFSVPEPELRRALSSEHGAHAILEVVVDGEKKARPAVLKDFQRHPTRGDLLHVDLQIVRLDEAIHSSVAVVLVGDAPGVRAGGVVAPGARELNVEALPTQIPDQIEADISKLEIGDSLHLSDLTPPEGVIFLDDPEALIVSITTGRMAIEVEEVEEEAEEAEEAEVEGEAGEGESSSE